jgi:hypothetical protein
MKIVAPACLALLLIFCVQFVEAQPIIQPGSFTTLTDAPADGGASGDNGNLQFDMASSFNVNTRTIRARVRTHPNALAGEGVASSRIFYEFQVGSTPESFGQALEGLVTYSVDWSGQQLIITGGLSNADIDSVIVLRDMTTGTNIYTQQVHQLDLETYKVRKVTLGLNYNDSGNTSRTFPAIFRRGHTYRVTLSMATTAFLLSPILSGSSVVSDYSGEGVHLGSLAVMLEIDQRDLLRRLERVENHRHVYLTGRGEGHNNTEAVSSSPVIVEEKKLVPVEDEPKKPR